MFFLGFILGGMSAVVAQQFLKDKAEADSTKALAEALAKNQDLVALKTAEKWNGVLPTYIPQGTVMPFVQLPQK